MCFSSIARVIFVFFAFVVTKRSFLNDTTALSFRGCTTCNTVRYNKHL